MSKVLVKCRIKKILKNGLNKKNLWQQTKAIRLFEHAFSRIKENKNRMKKSIKWLITIAMLVLLFNSLSFSGEISSDFTKIPEKGIVTMIDLGATECIPCKMMAPILVKLEKAYKGKAAIAFIDVWKNNAQAKRFAIRGIPTQIFFDKSGKEVFRHTGFFDEEAIIRQLTKMGVAAPEKNNKG